MLGLGNCIKCWDSTCCCGHDYMYKKDDEIIEFMGRLTVLLARRMSSTTKQIGDKIETLINNKVKENGDRVHYWTLEGKETKGE